MDRPAVLILLCVILEKIPSDWMLSTLMLYLHEILHMRLTASAIHVSICASVVYFSTVPWSYLAGTRLSLFGTTATSLIVEILGMVIINVSAHSNDHGIADVSFLAGVYVTATGMGGSMTCLATFGAQKLGRDPDNPNQINERDDDDERRSFNNSYMLITFIGSIVAEVVLVIVQRRIGWPNGYTVAVVILVVALLTLLASYPSYSNHQQTLNSQREPPDVEGEQLNAGAGVNTTEGFRRELFRWSKPLLLVWLALVIPSAGFAVVTTLFIGQGRVLNRKIGSTTCIPPETLKVFANVSSAVTTLFLHITRKRSSTSWDGSSSNVRAAAVRIPLRIGVGLIIQGAAMVIALVVEYKLEAAGGHKVIDSCGKVPWTVFLLLPQYCLSGIGDALISGGKIEFFFEQTPENMKSMPFLFSNLAVGSGNILNFILVKVLKNAAAASHLLVLCLLCTVNILFFFGIRHIYVGNSANLARGTPELLTGRLQSPAREERDLQERVAPSGRTEDREVGENIDVSNGEYMDHPAAGMIRVQETQLKGRLAPAPHAAHSVSGETQRQTQVPERAPHFTPHSHRQQGAQNEIKVSNAGEQEQAAPAGSQLHIGGRSDVDEEEEDVGGGGGNNHAVNSTPSFRDQSTAKQLCLPIPNTPPPPPPPLKAKHLKNSIGDGENKSRTIKTCKYRSQKPGTISIPKSHMIEFQLAQAPRAAAAYSAVSAEPPAPPVPERAAEHLRPASRVPQPGGFQCSTTRSSDTTCNKAQVQISTAGDNNVDNADGEQVTAGDEHRDNEGVVGGNNHVFKLRASTITPNQSLSSPITELVENHKRTSRDVKHTKALETAAQLKPASRDSQSGVLQCESCNAQAEITTVEDVNVKEQSVDMRKHIHLEPPMDWIQIPHKIMKIGCNMTETAISLGGKHADGTRCVEPPHSQTMQLTEPTIIEFDDA